MSMTMTQKILAAHAGLQEVRAGQLIEDIRLTIECKRPVKLCNRMGGNLLTVADVCDAARNMLKEVK